MSRRKNSLISKVGQYVRRSVSVSNNIKIIPETTNNKTSCTSSSSNNPSNESNAITTISYPNTYQYFPADVVVLESYAIHKIPERLKKRWGYVHVPSSLSSPTEEEEEELERDDEPTTSENKKKLRRRGFIAPAIGIPSDFPVFDSIPPSRLRQRFYYYYI